MSDETKRNDTDPAMQVAHELRGRLRAMPAEELIELAAQLLTTYVIEGVVPTARAGEAIELAPDVVGEETFAQMLKRLKASKKDPVLERFIIDGENISVRIDGQGVLPITEYRRPNTPPPSAPGVSIQQMPPQQRRESAPGAASSIYNRALYQEQAPAPQRNAPIQPAPQQQQQRPAPAVPAQPGQPAQQKDQKQGEQRDRFSLIELE